MYWMQINLVGWQWLNRVWFRRKEGRKRRDRRKPNGGNRAGRKRKEHVRRRRRRRGEGGGGWWDVVIARPIHHAMPAGMHWGQSCTTQLQPVLGCCSGLRYVPTTF